MSYVVPALFIVLMWWFSTGAVLWFARQSDGSSVLPLLSMLGVGLLGLVGVYFSSYGAGDMAGSSAITYLAVMSALAVWALVEFTFLTGQLTGARRAPCPAGVSHGERFRLAFQAINYHEYALVAALVGIGLISISGGNLTAFATFALLWIMRISAKLTLYSGAPKFALDMMPAKIAYLQTYFRHDRIGPIFWLSTLAFTASFAAALYSLISGNVPAQHTAAGTMLTTLLGLGVVEHWFMVLPIADSALWRWALPHPETHDTKVDSTLNHKNERRRFLMTSDYPAVRENRKGATL